MFQWLAWNGSVCIGLIKLSNWCVKTTIEFIKKFVRFCEKVFTNEHVIFTIRVGYPRLDS